MNSFICLKNRACSTFLLFIILKIFCPLRSRLFLPSLQPAQSRIHLIDIKGKLQFSLSASPSVDLYLISEKSIWKKSSSMNCSFSGWRPTSDMTYSQVLLQKLCKNCPHPEKPFSNSKTIRERPLMTSDFRVGRGVQNDPKNRTFQG